MIINIMMTTVINLKDIDFSFFEKLKKQFGEREVRITIKEGKDSKTFHRGVFDELEELQKKYPPFVVSKEIDLSDLANEVNL